MNDSLRQISNLILAPLMWIYASLGFIIEGANRPGDLPDPNTNL